MQVDEAIAEAFGKPIQVLWVFATCRLESVLQGGKTKNYLSNCGCKYAVDVGEFVSGVVSEDDLVKIPKSQNRPRQNQ